MEKEALSYCNAEGRGRGLSRQVAAFCPRQPKYVLAPSRLLCLKKKKRGSGGRGVRGQNGSAFWAVSGQRAKWIKKIWHKQTQKALACDGRSHVSSCTQQKRKSNMTTCAHLYIDAKTNLNKLWLSGLSNLKLLWEVVWCRVLLWTAKRALSGR